jgi:hypothetical protein
VEEWPDHKKHCKVWPELRKDKVSEIFKDLESIKCTIVCGTLKHACDQDNAYRIGHHRSTIIEPEFAQY